MHRLKTTLLSLALTFAAAPIALADDFFVKPSGNDNASGRSMSDAFRTIRRAVRAAGPGDTVKVADGTYDEGIIDLDRDGRPGQPITYTGLNYKGPKLIGSLRTSGDYLVIRNFDVTNPGDGYGISTWRNHNVTIQANEVHGCGGGGIGSDQSDAIKIEGNVTYNNARKNLDQHSGISVFQPRNLTNGGVDGGGFGIVIRNNTAFNNKTTVHRAGKFLTDGNGICVDDLNHNQGSDQPRYTKGVLVENNVAFDNGGAGIQVYDSFNVVVRHNTAVNNGRVVGYDIGELNVDRSNNVRFYNNIAKSVGGAGNRHAVHQHASYDIGFEHNVIHRDGGNPVRGASLWGGNVIADPQFVGGTYGGDYRLSAGSPAVDAGLSNPWLPWDDRGWGSRVRGSRADAGAFER